MVEEVAEWAADGCFFGMGEIVGLGTEHVLGAAADSPRLQLLDVIAEGVDLVLEESFIVSFDFLGLDHPLVCDFVQLFQPISVTVNALLEGVLLNLANDRVHVLLDIFLHHSDLLEGLGELRSFPLVEDGLAEGLKFCSSCLSLAPDHLLDTVVEVIKI